MPALQTITAKTETTITVLWEETSSTAPQSVCYSTDNGATWSAKDPVAAFSGYFTIENLAPATTYSIRTRVYYDAVHYANSGSESVTTYAYPYAVTMPDFTLADPVTISIYNPLNKSMLIALNDCNGTEITTVSKAGTSATFFPNNGIDWSSEIAALYSSIPNALNANYSISVSVDYLDPLTEHTETRTGGLYNVNQTDSKPVITSLTYADSNATSAAITGDASQIVQNISTPLFTGSGIAAQNSATLASAQIEVNGATYINGSPGATTNIQGGTINSTSNVIATLTVTDSRGLTAQKTVEVEMVAWNNPTGIITVQREQNFYTETDVTVDADYTYIGTNAVTITLTADAVPITGKTTPAQVVTTIPENTLTVVNMDNEFEWNISITIVDSFGGTTTYTGIHIGRGIPINFTDRILRSYAVNGFPTHENSIEVFDGSFYKDGTDIASLFPLTEYTNTSSGTLTSLLNRTQTFTVSGDGVLLFSASLRAGTNTWGNTIVTISRNGTDIAKASDAITANYNGQITAASASAFLQVSNGDAVTVTYYSTRYASGNTYDAYYNVLALGCTLTVS